MFNVCLQHTIVRDLRKNLQEEAVNIHNLPSSPKPITAATEVKSVHFGGVHKHGFLHPVIY